MSAPPDLEDILRVARDHYPHLSTHTMWSRFEAWIGSAPERRKRIKSRPPSDCDEVLAEVDRHAGLLHPGTYRQLTEDLQPPGADLETEPGTGVEHALENALKHYRSAFASFVSYVRQAHATKGVSVEEVLDGTEPELRALRIAISRTRTALHNLLPIDLRGLDHPIAPPPSPYDGRTPPKHGSHEPPKPTGSPLPRAARQRRVSETITAALARRAGMPACTSAIADLPDDQLGARAVLDLLLGRPLTTGQARRGRNMLGLFGTTFRAGLGPERQPWANHKDLCNPFAHRWMAVRLIEQEFVGTTHSSVEGQRHHPSEEHLTAAQPQINALVQAIQEESQLIDLASRLVASKVIREHLQEVLVAGSSAPVTPHAIHEYLVQALRGGPASVLAVVELYHALRTFRCALSLPNQRGEVDRADRLLQVCDRTDHLLRQHLRHTLMATPHTLPVSLDLGPGLHDRLYRAYRFVATTYLLARLNGRSPPPNDLTGVAAPEPPAPPVNLPMDRGPAVLRGFLMVACRLAAHGISPLEPLDALVMGGPRTKMLLENLKRHVKPIVEFSGTNASWATLGHELREDWPVLRQALQEGLDQFRAIHHKWAAREDPDVSTISLSPRTRRRLLREDARALCRQLLKGSKRFWAGEPPLDIAESEWSSRVPEIRNGWHKILQTLANNPDTSSHQRSPHVSV